MSRKRLTFIIIFYIDKSVLCFFMKINIINNVEMAKRMLEKKKEVYAICNNDVRNNEDVIKLAVQLDVKNCVLIPEEKQENIDFMKSLIRIASPVLMYSNEKIKHDCDFIAELINNDIEKSPEMMFDYLPEDVKDNKEFVLKIINKEPSIYKKLSSKLYNDYDIIKQAIQHFPRLYYTLSMENQDKLVKDGIVELHIIKNMYDGCSIKELSLLKTIYDGLKKAIQKELRKDKKDRDFTKILDSISTMQNDGKINPEKINVVTKIATGELIVSCNRTTLCLTQLNDYDYQELSSYIADNTIATTNSNNDLKKE